MDDKALKIQLIKDNIATKKSKGQAVPQGWINKLAELQGETLPLDGVYFTNEVFGHPSATNIAGYEHLIPIKITSLTQVNEKLDKISDILAGLNHQIGLYYAAKTKRIKVKNPGNPQNIAHLEAIRDMLNQETIPELMRIREFYS